jgi:hypothetical protein
LRDFLINEVVYKITNETTYLDKLGLGGITQILYNTLEGKSVYSETVQEGSL